MRLWLLLGCCLSVACIGGGDKDDEDEDEDEDEVSDDTGGGSGGGSGGGNQDIDSDGYPASEDCNDTARLGEDPVHKLLLDRDPMEGMGLASQSTLSRFENAIGPKSLMRMGSELADTVIERHRKRLRGRVKRITVELDPTDDPTHGGQQLTFFNTHYDTWCYLPVAGFVQFNDEPEQYLFAYVLRPGNADAKLGAIGILRRVLERLREAFPRAKVLVLLDAG